MFPAWQFWSAVFAVAPLPVGPYSRKTTTPLASSAFPAMLDVIVAESFGITDCAVEIWVGICRTWTISAVTEQSALCWMGLPDASNGAAVVFGELPLYAAFQK